MLPPFPDELIPWLRMSVEKLTPREYWATSQYDVDMCIAVKAAYREGVEAASADHKRAEDQRREDAERLEQLKARMR